MASPQVGGWKNKTLFELSGIIKRFDTPTVESKSALINIILTNTDIQGSSPDEEHLIIVQDKILDYREILENVKVSIFQMYVTENHIRGTAIKVLEGQYKGKTYNFQSYKHR
jgi:hypothetical protein